MNLIANRARGNGALEVLAILMQRKPKQNYTPRDSYESILYNEGYQQCLKDFEKLITDEANR